MNDRPVPVSLPAWLAGVLVFTASGMVLVLEIVGVRLLAPFVGSSLDTYTAIIGTVLAGISAGTYLGGRLADRIPAQRLLGPVLLISGATSLLIVPVTRAVGASVSGAPSLLAVVVLSAVALLIPAAVLSAISPIVVKLQLSSLATSGATVGRLSALGTAGAIAGTFLTGFVLLTYFRTSTIVLTIGVLLVVAGVALTAVYRRTVDSRTLAACAAAVLVGAPLTVSAGGFCEEESKYYCMRLVDADGDARGQYLALDHLLHSYVDTNEPTALDFWYVQAMAASFDVLRPASDVETLTVGGGGFTIPRYLGATREDSRTVSLELDAKLVDFNERRLALNEVPRLEVVTGDARPSVTGLADDRFDLVIGDAFGNESVPWHLSTLEFSRQLDRVMTDDGLLVMNVIDYGSRDLLRSVAATLQQVWPNVAVVERRRGGAVVDGNFVVLASRGAVNSDELRIRLVALSEPAYLVDGQELDRFVADAPVLTDDFAPADQLLANNLP